MHPFNPSETQTESSAFVRQGRLVVEAAGVNGFGADPAPNLIIINVMYEGGGPVGGLAADDFTVINYAMTDGHARKVKLRLAQELSVELPASGIRGVYKVEPEEELAITGQVGQTAYAVSVTFTVESPQERIRYSGQTVLSIVMQPRP